MLLTKKTVGIKNKLLIWRFCDLKLMFSLTKNKFGAGNLKFGALKI